MKTKILTPVFLLMASVLSTFIIFSCSKDNMPKVADRQLQTSSRSVLRTVIDSLVGSWRLRKVEIITIKEGPHRADTVTTLYDTGSYTVKYYDNGTGTEFIKNAEVGKGDDFTIIPFTYGELDDTHIEMREQSPGVRSFNFRVYFPHQKFDHVHLTQIIRREHETIKTIWHMEDATFRRL